MSESPINPERGELRTLTRINVLIHPLWKIKPDEYMTPDRERFDRERRQMAEVMLNEMSPRSKTEVTYFMPMLTESKRDSSLRDQLIKIKGSKDYLQWTDLYRDMVKKVGHGRNIILGTNLVGVPWITALSPEHFTQDLEKRGFRIDENTEIVVGGEMLRACLQIGIDRLLELPVIHSLKVNSKASLTAGYLLSSDKSLDQADYDDFMKHYTTQGLNVSQNRDIYTVSKKN